MADRSTIAWCDATINPCFGCSPVSEGCRNCYAARMAHRSGELTAGTVKDGRWTGKINRFQERMDQAFLWRKPRRIFVGSMTDLFHEEIPNYFLDEVFQFMAVAKQHTFLLLTKRPERARQYIVGMSNARFDRDRMLYDPRTRGPVLAFSNRPWPLPNVWHGVTAENQAMADERIPILLDTPAAKRFVSVEPMLGPVDLTCINYPDAVDHEVGLLDALRGMSCDDDPTHPALDWVIAGGESGPHARPMHPDWVRSLRDQCKAARVPYFFKQWGEWAPYDPDNGIVPTPTNKFQWGTVVPSGLFYSQTTPCNARR